MVEDGKENGEDGFGVGEEGVMVKGVIGKGRWEGEMGRKGGGSNGGWGEKERPRELLLRAVGSCLGVG